MRYNNGNRCRISHLESFNPNIEEVSDNIFLGPQADILEELERFNERWETKLKLTKKFYWAPGTYNEVKGQYSNKALRFEMKPSGMYSIFDRMDSYSYMRNNFKRDIMRIEDMRMGLLRNGTIMTDNTDQIEEGFNEIKERLMALNSIDNVSVVLEEYYNDDALIDADYRGYNWLIKVRIPSGYINVMHNTNDTDTQCIGEVYRDDADILFSINVFKHLNWWISGTASNGWLDGYRQGDNRMHLSAHYHGMHKLLQHPYISHYYGGYDNEYPKRDEIDIFANRQFRGNLCFGNLGKDIQTNMYKLDIDSVKAFLKLWSNVYNIGQNQTNPLNNIRNSIVGKPSNYSPEFLAIVGLEETCKVEIKTRELSKEQIEDFYPELRPQCDAIDCVRRDNCNFYDKVNHEMSEKAIEAWNWLYNVALYTRREINTNFNTVFKEDDQYIDEFLAEMRDTYNYWQAKYELWESQGEEDVHQIYTFINCYENPKVFKKMIDDAELTIEERRANKPKITEKEVLENLLRQGLTANPIEVDPHPHNSRNNHIPEPADTENDIVEETQRNEFRETVDAELIRDLERELDEDAENVSPETIIENEEDITDEPFLNNS